MPDKKPLFFQKFVYDHNSEYIWSKDESPEENVFRLALKVAELDGEVRKLKLRLEEFENDNY